MPKTVSILGSTGSIGLSALRVIDEFYDDFIVQGLCCNSSAELLKRQLKKYRPKYAALADDRSVGKDMIDSLRSEFSETEFFWGTNGVLEFVQNNVDILLSSVVGAAGLKPTLQSMPYAARIALANKETLVMAGDIVMKEALKHNTEIIPVDSEHSAVFSLLEGGRKKSLRRIILTASGGSLRDYTENALERVTVKEALAHPNWEMGKKITIDSATLMNKGFEVIEAHHLFDLPYDKIDVVIHPESIIHSMVETVDGSVYAHMGVPDMAFPISSAFLYPEKRENCFGRLDFSKLKQLSFRGYDSIRFPALKLCYEAGRLGGTATAVLNAANEIAVMAFLEEKISFRDITSTVEKVLSGYHNIKDPCIEEIYQADSWARNEATNVIMEIMK